MPSSAGRAFAGCRRESGEFISGMVRERMKMLPSCEASSIPPSSSISAVPSGLESLCYSCAILCVSLYNNKISNIGLNIHVAKPSKSVPQEAVACMPMIRDQPGPRHDTGYSRQSRLTTRTDQERTHDTGQTFRAMCCQRWLGLPCHPSPHVAISYFSARRRRRCSLVKTPRTARKAEAPQRPSRYARPPLPASKTRRIAEPIH
jgi:hypothetical protein